eukprot:5021892-Amphidinium_carterae.2
MKMWARAAFRKVQFNRSWCNGTSSFLCCKHSLPTVGHSASHSTEQNISSSLLEEECIAPLFGTLGQNGGQDGQLHVLCNPRELSTHGKAVRLHSVRFFRPSPSGAEVSLCLRYPPSRQSEVPDPRGVVRTRSPPKGV